jgi:hypothetical protein
MSFTPKTEGNASSLANRIRKLAALSASDRNLICYACLLMPVVWVSLRLLGLARTLAWAAVPRSAGQISNSRVLPPASLGRLVNIAARYGPIRAACLVRSLVLIRILGGRGVVGVLQIGVRKAVSSKLDAHAWVEFDGIPVNDDRNVAKDFAVFDTLDTSVVGALL